MDSYGTLHNRPSTSSASALRDGAQEQPESDSKTRTGTRIGCFISIPASPEAAAVRIVKNFGCFGIFYILIVGAILFVSLVPRRPVSLIFLVVMSLVISSYLLLLRALPNSAFLHKIIDKRLVLALLLIVIVVVLIITRAGIHLTASIAIGLPLSLLHAILREGDDEDAAATKELDPLVHNKVSDAESQA